MRWLLWRLLEVWGWMFDPARQDFGDSWIGDGSRWS